MSYKEILQLKQESDAPKRGYMFEQSLREILPWSYRPPITASTSSEQLDAFFEWNSWHFLVEAKAKKKVITAGSHDWEDFELKIRKRKGQCIGLFCSLYDVNDEVLRSAEMLNKEGFTTIVIAGAVWIKLFESNIRISDYIRYSVFQARSKFKPISDDLDKIKDWVFSRDEINLKIHAICTKESSVFLRRHKISHHENVYVERKVDENLASFINLLKPSKLNSNVKSHTHDGKLYSSDRGKPKQITLVRDLSGAGKTTLSVNLSLDNDNYFGSVKAALQNDIDCFIDRLLDIDDSNGLESLLYVDKPIVFVIDSLDESLANAQKRKEVMALIKGIEELNNKAKLRGLLCYPIMLVFTIREDFWRDWESTFEGLEKHNLKKRFSYFNYEETILALNKYSNSFNYNIKTKLNKQHLDILSHPFNLQIFSEAHEYEGDVYIDDVMDDTVLKLFFDRKKDDIHKRPISGFYPNILMALCSSISAFIAKSCKNEVSYDKVISIIRNDYSSLSEVSDLIVKNLISEQIIVRDTANTRMLRFRHMKFVEYLTSYYIARTLHTSNNPKKLDEMISSLINEGFLSIYYIHEFIRSICKAEFYELYENLMEYYAHSSEYMKRLVHQKRLFISGGEKVSNLDIDTIEKAMARGESEVCWEGFFVIAAKNNNRDKKTVLNAFDMAWKANESRVDRWKILNKLSQHKLLLEPTVFKSVMASNSTNDWYSFIDGVILAEQFNDFKSIMDEYNFPCLLKHLALKEGSEWTRVIQLLESTYQGQKYELGA
ncbi:NACHT domain-containing protein [Pseudoalteromonas piratica]|uniref:Restriction endonuclease type IV Mrr domain-containing protein n=1 Tax=Pseudoalteromonas piratica TaxID=1348114 RepID=A0A0A7ENC5_9GAMM|nr:hypothetical protein [Pseudoalteromonas piratica]AIY67581.1 hypothetical protein OM33_21550 [Pseudoalteromonas piratica]